MLAFLYNNTTFLFVFIVILTLIAMYYHFKSLPAKVTKKEDKKEDKAEPAKKEEVVEQKEEKTTGPLNNPAWKSAVCLDFSIYEIINFLIFKISLN